MTIQPLFSSEDVKDFDVQNIGGKAHQLLHLFRRGFNIPQSWIIPTREYLAHLKEAQVTTDILLNETNNDVNRLTSICQKIEATPLRVDLLEDVGRLFDRDFLKDTVAYALRSSANVEDHSAYSFAGIFDSYLPIDTPESFIYSIKKCWSSAWSLRVSRYCEAIHVKQAAIRMAILIQKVVHARIAGVAYTIDPVSLDETTKVIESVSGLGDKLVSGTQTPNHYRLSNSGEVLNKRIHSPSSDLSEDDMLWLRNLIGEIEKLYDQPQEIEWAIDQKNHGYILQSRPITTIQ